MQAGSIVATNGAIIFEYWHGIDLPPNMLIPKVAAQAVVKCSKPLAKRLFVVVGYVLVRRRFVYQDANFFGTIPRLPRRLGMRLFANVAGSAQVAKAVAAVATFSEGVRLPGFKAGQIVSDMNAETPSFYRLEGLPEGEGLQGKYLSMIEGRATKMLFRPKPQRYPRPVLCGRAAALPRRITCASRV